MQADTNEDTTSEHPRRANEGHQPSGLGSRVRIFWDEVRKVAAHHIPAALLLTFLTAALHVLHPMEWADAFFMRWVVQSRADEVGRGVEMGRLEDRIHLLEVSAGMRLRSLELPDHWALDDAAVRRLEGIRPIDRAAMADLLERLALRLGPPGSACSRAENRVLVIDVDLAPLDASPESLRQRARMIAALEHLRCHVHVVTIVMERETESLQTLRNAFMVGAGCTPFAHPTPEPSNAANDLYFASPRLFRLGHDYPLRFPTRLLKSDPPIALPREFPALGTLIHLRREPTASADDARTLTLLCEQARAATAASPVILEDWLAKARPQALLEMLGHYEQAYFNWPLLETHVVGAFHITSPESIGPAPNDNAGQARSAVQKGGTGARVSRLGDDRLIVPVLVLAIKAAGSNDHFEGASSGETRFSGAKLHILQAASRAEPLRANASVFGSLADLGIGLLFVLAWAAADPLLHRLRDTAPWIGFVTSAAVPLAIAWPLVLLSRRVANELMDQGHWFNPGLVIAGLALHVYLQRTDDKTGHAVDWTFGLRPSFEVARRWLRGSSAPIPPVEQAPASAPIAMPSRASRWRAWDLWLATGVRVGIFVAGFAVLFNGAWLARSTTDLLILVTGVAALAVAAIRQAGAQAHREG